ncbi:MAG: M15 family metallopeptidase [Burkholderiales bacterium]
MLPSVLIGISLYFLLAVGLALLLLVPAARAGAWRFFAQALSQLRALSGQRAQQLQAVGQGFGQRALDAGSWTRSRAPWLVAALLVLVLVPAALLWLRWYTPPETYDHRALRPSDPRVAALLRGEQLVPPAPLPPEFFMRAEVEQVRPMTRTANREWALLDAEFRQRLLVVFQVLRERHGIEAVLLEGYRSPERQAQLQAMGSHVTQAGAFESYHQYGLAADVAFLREGRIVISERDPWAMQGYERLGEAAQSLGLVWGGSWRSLKDYGHVELRRPGVLKRGQETGSAAAGAAH